MPPNNIEKIAQHIIPEYLTHFVILSFCLKFSQKLYVKEYDIPIEYLFSLIREIQIGVAGYINGS